MRSTQSLGRKLPARSISAVFLLALACCAPAHAQYVVTQTTDNGLGNTAGTLSNAILQANATGGAITFNLNGGATTLTLTGSMYGISAVAPIFINGGGVTINAAGFQAFTVNAGNVDFQNLTINGGRAQGQAGGNGNGGGGGGMGGGGAIYVDPNAGAVGIQNVSFTNNQAVGGAGGNANGVSANGGIGGGYNGNAGPNTAPSGTGGGAGAVGAGDGSAGGYGGGGGGGSTGATTPAPGNLGGNGGLSGQGGNGGQGLGGALFIGDGNTTWIRGGTLIADTNSASGGAGGEGTSTANDGVAGAGNGSGLYVGYNSIANFDNSTTEINVNANIYSSGFITIHGSGNSVVNFTGTTTIDTLANPPANITVASGTLNGNTDSLTGPIYNDSILRFTQANVGTFNGELYGIGQIQIEGGGTVVFSDTNSLTGQPTNMFQYLGSTNINNGKLLLNTTLQNSNVVNIGGNGTLLGNGLVHNQVVNNGTFAPGNNGIGTFTIFGNYTANPNSTTQIEVNNAGNTPGTNNDLIIVNSDVNLNGGNVAVVAAGTNYTSGSTYTFLQYGGIRNGTFDGIITNSAFLDATLLYDDIAQTISFQLMRNGTDYASIARTFNERAVAGNLDANSFGAQGDLLTLLNNLNTLDATAARNALNQLSGEAYGTSAQLQFQNTTLQIQLLVQHISSLGNAAASENDIDADIVEVVYHPGKDEIFEFVCRSDNRPSSSVWATSYGLGGVAQNDGNAAGLDYGLGGTLVGRDHWLDDSTLAGLYGGYNYAHFNGDELTQSVTANSGQFGGYLRRNFDQRRHVLLASGLGFDAYESSRAINIGGLNATARGDYDGWQSVTYGEYGRTFRLGAGNLTPYAGLQYIYLRQNGFTETDGGPANLTVSGIDAHSLRNVLGLRFDRQYRAKSGRVLTPQLRASWLHEYLDTNTLVSNRFAGTTGTSFAASGLDLGRDWALLGGGVGWQLTDQWSLTANYDSQVNQYQTFHAGSAMLQYVW